MRILIIYLLVSGGLFWGCSKDDLPSLPIDKAAVPDFSALGENLEHVYQYDYISATEQANIVDLTQENAIDNQFISLRQDGETLTFYTFSLGNFSAIQRNVRTGTSRVLENVYSISEDRSVVWGTNSPEKVFFGYFMPQGSDKFGLRTLDIASGAVADIPVEDHVQNVYEPLYSDGKLFVTYQTDSDIYRTAILDASNSQILRTWDFGLATPSFFIEDAGDIALITRVDGNEYIKAIYDFDTLEKRSETAFSVNRYFAPGPLQAELVHNKLYYLNYYAQPSAVPYGPAVYDFIKGENSIIDMIGIVQEIQIEVGSTITLTAHRYSPAGKSFLFGYARKSNNGQFQGGILVISEDGTLIEHLTTPFVPIYFLESLQ